MKRFQFVFFFTLAALTLAFPSQPPTLSYKAFEEEIVQTDFVLVNFRSHLSQPSQAFDSTFDQVAEKLSESHPQVKVAIADVSKDFNYGAHFNLLKFPTVKLFVKGLKLPLHYFGDQNVDSIVSWVSQKTSSVASQVFSKDELDALLQKKENTGLFIGSRDTQAWEEFVKLARFLSSEEINFVFSVSDDIKELYNVKEGEEKFIVFTRNGAEKNIYENKAFDFDKLKIFVYGEIRPAVLPFDSYTRHRLFEEDEDIIILFKRKGEVDQEVRDAFHNAASALKNEIGFTEVTYGDNLKITMFELLNLELPLALDINSENDLPLVAIIKTLGQLRKYVLYEKITEESIKDFAKDYLNKEIKYYTQTAAIPSAEGSYVGNVRVLVGKNFNSVVYDESKDVLVNLCESNQCDSTYLTIARKYGNTKDLVVARMDTMANYVEALDKVDFNALVLFPKKGKDTPIVYTGAKTEQALVEFLKQNTDLELTTSEEKTVNIEL